MNWTLLLAAVGLLFAACGGGENKAGEAQAALEAARPDFEARRANITAALKQAAELRDQGHDGGVAAFEWGDRPAAKFLDVRNNKLDKQANGRIFELSAANELSTDPKSMLGLFADVEWPARLEETLGGKALSKGQVESALEKYLAVRYLCLLVADDFAAAELGTGTLFTVNFKPGHWKGRAFYFDLEQGKLIGGKAFEVRNSDKIDFKTESGAEDVQRKRAAEACTEDLRLQIMAAASSP
ncbi:MAG: hypothetical protein KDB90_05175 [Planctomycetes bacterium]|nr:hypothetical protein [Planctomycetota bacterium]